MKKLHLDKNSNVKILIYILSIFVLLSMFLSFLYKGIILDFVSVTYNKLFVSQNKNNILLTENEQLKNEIQNYKNIILEKNISEEQISFGIIDKIKAEKISFNIFNKNIIYSEILLNKGSIAGVEVRDRVYMLGLKPVGITTESNINSSKLRLYSDNNFENEYILKSKQEIDLSEAATSTASSKDYIFTGSGDGAYGILIKIPSNLSVYIKDLVYSKDDVINPVGEIVSVQDITSQKEKLLYVKTYYNSATHTSFYITK